MLAPICSPATTLFPHICLQKRLIEGWDTFDYVIKSALFHSIVTVYTRPFITNNTNRPGKIFRYRISQLKKAAGFDLGLHDHLCTLRSTLIAHRDTSVIKARVGRSAITPRDGSKPPLALETYGMTKALSSIAVKDIAERYLAHIAACEVYLTKAGHDALGRLHMAMVHYPDLQLANTQSLPAFELKPLPDGTLQLPDIEALSNMNRIAVPNSFLPEESYLWLEFIDVFALTGVTYHANGEPIIEVFNRAE
jgi:hypothetical protein